MSNGTIHCGDSLSVLKTLPSESVQMCVTSPPYFGLRKYIEDGEPEKQYEIGIEETPNAYVQKLVELFREVRRVLKDDGTLWLNLGDSYSAGGRGGNTEKQQSNRGTRAIAGKPFSVPGYGPKQLLGIPWRVAFALQADGWILRQDIIWSKPNPMPESVTDRCTKSHEYIFLLAKSQKYYFNNEAIKEKSVYSDPWMIDGFVPKSDNGKHKGDPQATSSRKKYEKTHAGGGSGVVGHNGYFKADGTPIGEPGMRNKRDVWNITVSPYAEAHFATFPEDLIVPCILAGSPPGGVVLDPFLGSGTTGKVAQELGRDWIGIELNPKYVELAKQRTSQKTLL